ncbi:CBS domain-containing protein [Anaerobacillus sp. HL2]|nr:CBS domain-containing protein [Anaerobacillus sp. HL2]
MKMVEHSLSSILVLTNSRLVGIVTEKDIVGRVIAENRSLSLPVSEIMTRNPITISKDQILLRENFNIFLTNAIKHLPVVHKNQVVGIVTLTDLFHKKIIVL